MFVFGEKGNSASPLCLWCFDLAAVVASSKQDCRAEHINPIFPFWLAEKTTFTSSLSAAPGWASRIPHAFISRGFRTQGPLLAPLRRPTAVVILAPRHRVAWWFQINPERTGREWNILWADDYKIYYSPGLNVSHNIYIFFYNALNWRWPKLSGAPR